MIKIVNQTVPAALFKLFRHPRTDRRHRQLHRRDRHHIQGAPHIKDEHLAVFDLLVQAQQRYAFLDSIILGHLDEIPAAHSFNISGARYPRP